MQDTKYEYNISLQHHGHAFYESTSCFCSFFSASPAVCRLPFCRSAIYTALYPPRLPLPCSVLISRRTQSLIR